MAARRGLHYPEGENVDIVEVLPPGARQAYDDYLALRKDREGMGGEFVFDAEQHADRATCGPFFSSFLTHGTIISASLGKLLVPQEHLLAMGEAIFEDHVDPMYLCPFKCLLEPGVRAGLRNLSAYQQKFLAGQAVHTHVIGALQFYGLQRITKRKPSLVSMMSDAGVADEIDDDA